MLHSTQDRAQGIRAGNAGRIIAVHLSPFGSLSHNGLSQNGYGMCIYVVVTDYLKLGFEVGGCHGDSVSAPRTTKVEKFIA